MKRVIAGMLSAVITLAGIFAVLPDKGKIVKAAAETDMQAEERSETEFPDEAETEAESKSETESEAETETETKRETEIETEMGTEVETEIETETKTEVETETETESEMETETEAETETETEAGTETETEVETEIKSETEAEAETETEMESERETEAETESETEAETMAEPQTESYRETPKEATGGYSYWDFSWYISEDWRFTQIDKEYALVKEIEGVCVKEAQDEDAKTVGEIPYFGVVYILQNEGEWSYIESGDVRGFVRSSSLTSESFSEEVVMAVGEDSFNFASPDCEKFDNAAFTYTHTTVHEVIADKNYALLLYSGNIYEYPEDTSRTVGQANSGTLVYVLEKAEDYWLFVESGDVRGFIPESMLLTGSMAEDVVGTIGEEQIALAEEQVAPEENRSCYYTLKSVTSASGDIGEQIADFAVSFVGKLPYVWGGTSLISGADCSGFVQSIYAAFGIHLPRLAEVQGASGQTVPSLELARPGDVVYWADGPHVGIYIGNGKVVQCSGGRANTSGNPGRGPTISDAAYRPITSIRRFLIKDTVVRGKHRTDPTQYSRSQMELIWAIVAQEDNGSYDGALAVISSAMNRTESVTWNYCGNTALAQLTAPGQYCYSNDDYWRPRLGGNVPEYVKQAVNDCLKKGIRNHSFTSFRSTKGSVTGPNAVQIGGNWFFGS